MTAQSTEAPLVPGHLLVRAPRVGGELHIVAIGAQIPAQAVFTVPLECMPDAQQAPAVRSYDGPADPDRLCQACVRALTGEPEPEPVPLAAVPALMPPLEAFEEALPFDSAVQSADVRHLRAVPDLPRYSVPPLLAYFRGRSVQWKRWGRAPVVSHIASACDWCGDPGPCMMAAGHSGDARSRTTPLTVFLALRCGYCQEMTVYEQVTGDLKEIAHHRPKSAKDEAAGR
jgi:hypothetical protein